MIRRGRFAPTPSGQLHIGNAFAALASWLQIRQASGEFIVRIEDIDKARSRPAFVEQMLNDLQWLGLNWDEGPLVGGPFAPYTQSLREPMYEAALEQLRSQKQVYPCFCSRSELAAISSAPHGLASEGAAYPGLCLGLSEAERRIRAESKQPAERFHMQDKEYRFEDRLTGEAMVLNGDAGDFIVKRADGMYSYQLAVIVDDAAMGITDVLRGSDLLDSTPRQLALYEALQLTPPSFAHIPLLADATGTRLSKRDKSITLASLQNNGLPATQLIGVLAYLAGWLDRPEPTTAQELIPLFKPIRTTDSESGMIVVSDSILSLLRGES